MRTRFVLALLVVVATVAAYGGTVLATSMHGVTSTVLGIAQFNEISAKFAEPDADFDTLDVAERHRARRVLRLALPSGAEPRDRQGRRPDVVPSGRSDVQSGGGPGRIRVRRRRWRHPPRPQRRQRRRDRLRDFDRSAGHRAPDRRAATEQLPRYSVTRILRASEAARESGPPSSQHRYR